MAPIAAAAISAYGAYRSSQAQADAARAGQNSSSSGFQQHNPWAPSAPYRQWVMDYGADILGMPRTPSGAYNNPYAPARNMPANVGGHVNENGDPIGPMSGNYNPAYQQDRADLIAGGVQSTGPGAGGRSSGQGATTGGGQWRRARPASGGGGGSSQPAAPAAPAYNGVSPESQQLRQQLMDRASSGSPLYGTANDFIQNQLTGGENNPYRTETADLVRGVTNDPDLSRFIQELWAGNTPGSSGNSPILTASAARGGVGLQGGISGAPGAGYSPESTGSAAALRALIAGGDAPGQQAVIDAITRQSGEAFANQMRAVKAQGAGTGMFGSTPFEQASAQAERQYGQDVTDRMANERMTNYRQALGLGTQFDISAADRAAQESMAANANRASGAAQSAALAQQADLARMGMLQNAIGMQQGGRQFQTSAMGNLAGLYSADNNYALGAVPDISGLDLRDLSAAAGYSGSLDQNQNNWQGIQNQLRVGLANASNARADTNLRAQMFYDPLSRLGQYTNILGAASGDYGETTNQGSGYQSIPYGGSPWASAASGALSGYIAGQQLQGGGAGGGAAPANTAGGGYIYNGGVNPYG